LANFVGVTVSLANMQSYRRHWLHDAAWLARGLGEYLLNRLSAFPVCGWSRKAIRGAVPPKLFVSLSSFCWAASASLSSDTC
jgi:hypothetical protein